MIGVPAASLSAWNTGINCASLNAGEWYCIASTTLDSGSPITTQPTDNSTMTGTLSGSATLSSGALSGSTTSTSRGSSSSPTSTTGVTSKSSSTALLSTTTKATSAATSSPVSLATPSPTQVRTSALLIPTLTNKAKTTPLTTKSRPAWWRTATASIRSRLATAAGRSLAPRASTSTSCTP